MSETVQLPKGAVLKPAKCEFRCPKISACDEGGECTVDRSTIASDGEPCHHDYQFVVVKNRIVALLTPDNQLIWC